MEVKKLESLPPNTNPFVNDLYHMGTPIGTNVMVMMPNHDTEECRYLIVVNIKTGERLRVNIV